MIAQFACITHKVYATGNIPKCSNNNQILKINAITPWPPGYSQNTWMCSNETVNRLIKGHHCAHTSYESISDID